MQDFTESLHTAPTLPILELVKELTIGQRATGTVIQLSAFLRADIFPKLWPFFIEIYFLDSNSGNFLPSESQNRSAGRRKEVPAMIPGNLSIIRKVAETCAPVEFLNQPRQHPLLAKTKNKNHLLVPILDGPKLSALLYLGSASPCSFTSDFLESIQTLAAVIGSRLKSMATIQQLRESMQALEYSDRVRTVLYEISEQAQSAENITDLYAKLHLKVGRLIHARNFFIALTENRQDGKYISFPYFIDKMDSRFQGTEVKVEQQHCCITGYLLKSGKPLLLTPENFDRICREQNIKCIGIRPNSWLGAPFFVGHISGVVAIQSYSKVIYTEKDKELMVFVARHIGDALNRKHGVDELKKAKERAEKAEKNKSTFLANMSHEIRTPMNGILGLTDLVLHSDISGQQRSYLEMIYSSAERLLKLINNILDFSKIEAGKLELDIAPFNLRDTVAGALEILAISAAKKNIELTVDCDEQIPRLLLGDAGKLSQILINLVGNGVKFTKKGRVTLRVQQKNSNRQVDDPIELHFQIQDTGIGIPQAKIKNIFKAFSQLVTTRTSSQRGTGLGLVIAGELVELMGGTINVESRPGVGTSFYFTIQCATVAKETMGQGTVGDISSLAKGANRSRKPLRILLVEDEYINRILVVTVLERKGWKVEVAENGIQAMNMLKDNVFDLILMDIQMPELDGFETTITIRQQEKNSGRHIPIIALTAYAVTGDREKCLAAGMDGYISKPIRSDRLNQEIETVLRQSSGAS